MPSTDVNESMSEMSKAETGDIRTIMKTDRKSEVIGSYFLPACMDILNITSIPSALMTEAESPQIRANALTVSMSRMLLMSEFIRILSARKRIIAAITVT